MLSTIKTSKRSTLLTLAALTGIAAGGSLGTAHAGQALDGSSSHLEQKNNCNGKSSCSAKKEGEGEKDKNSCNGKSGCSAKKEGEKDKNACSGKSSCNGKKEGEKDKNSCSGKSGCNAK